MKDRYQVLIDSQTNWDKDHPVMAEHNRDLLELWSLLHDEVQEAGDEVQEYLVHQAMGGVTNEVIDTLAKELDDVFLFLLQMYSMIGVDLFESVMDKRAYNITRMTSAMFSNGRTYLAARQASKEWVEQSGWKSEYYHPEFVPIYDAREELDKKRAENFDPDQLIPARRKFS